ncbi:hypothetical protein ADEAN_000360600 [Angomonas deanei]|uniref:Uncharacterized protein n=1 Tax=Angomonas deanei TaxID=59799 RepID=A0A7G2C9L2_9TRYP|nr:hypothetical protein ADEAN_000360600 [Angomonas deanei]
MYTLDMKQRLVRTESLERNVKLYYVVEGQLLADGEQPKKIHRVPSHSTTSEDDDEDYQVEERGSRRVTRPSIPFDGYAVPPGYGSY